MTTSRYAPAAQITAPTKPSHEPSFDLLSEPWIPLASESGEVHLVGLRNALIDSHKFRCLTAETPLCEGALLRLLVAAAHRIADVSSPQAWHKLMAESQFNAERIQRYLHEWHERFDLFHPAKPFLQDTSIQDADSSPVSRLAFYQDGRPMIKGRWEKATPPFLEPDVVARYLLAYEAFDVGGFKTRAYSGENNSAKEAPLRSSTLAMLQGTTLFETILLNMSLYNPEEGRPWPCDRELDMPAWERTDGNFAGPRTPTGYLDWLTPLSRRVLLRPETDERGVTGVRWVSITKGENAPEDFLTEHRDPMVPYHTVFRDKKPIEVPLRLSRGRAAWRDGYALLCGSGTSAVRCGNIAFALEHSPNDTTAGPIDVRVVGMGSDKSKIQFYSSSGVRLPAPYFHQDADDIRDALRCGIEIVEQTGRILRSVTREESPKPLATTRGDESTDVFWAATEDMFETFVTDLPTSTDPQQRVRQLARNTADAADRALDVALMGSDRLMRLGRASSKLHGIMRSTANKIIEGGSDDDDDTRAD